MATSNSTRAKRTTWSGGASVFSGRPDPVWDVKPSLATRLEKIWRGLKPVEADPPPFPVLGYRGCTLRGPRGREWFAFGGVVTLRSSAHPPSSGRASRPARSSHVASRGSVRGPESRRDPARKFERVLLASAPPGLLPPWLDA